MKLALSQAKNSMVDMANEEFPSEALGLAQALQASQIGPAADGTLNFDLALPRMSWKASYERPAPEYKRPM